ncbi:MAG: flavin reductase family protein [Acidipropionibacterium sp.]|nr:flavin reductase family protein [Acidipropionibacterium sp.]MCI1749644.1 flavin reductase family protein [Acidipropionibacterium sp.]
MSQPSEESSESSLRRDLAGVFRWHPAGAAVLTANGESGPVGLTVSSLASVSVDPAMVSLSIGHDSATLSALSLGTRVVLHPLDAGQERLGNEFARHGGTVPPSCWQTSAEGVPCLNVTTPRLHCAITRMIDLGPSTLLVLEADRIEPGRRGPAGMVWMGRRWHSVPR